ESGAGASHEKEVSTRVGPHQDVGKAITIYVEHPNACRVARPPRISRRGDLVVTRGGESSSGTQHGRKRTVRVGTHDDVLFAIPVDVSRENSARTVGAAIGPIPVCTRDPWLPPPTDQARRRTRENIPAAARIRTEHDVFIAI